MHIWKATKYLKDVTLKKQCETFRCYNGGVGRCLAQAKQWGWTQGRQPKKSTEVLLHVLKDAENNAELKGIGVDSLVIENVRVNKVPKMRCSTYRADGINLYVSSPCHAEMLITEREQIVPKLEEEAAQKKKMSHKKLKKQKSYGLGINAAKNKSK